MERMQEELRKRAKPQFFESQETPSSTENPARPGLEAPTPEPGHDQGTPESPSPESPTPSTETPPKPAAEDKGKKNPWKLVDTYKSEAAQAKARIAELEKAMPELTKLQEFQKSMESLNKRNEELEKEIRFVNYQKSGEFQEKYEKPYNAAWSRFAREIGQISASDKNGETRPGNVHDIAELANLPLGEAQMLAEERFGSLAGYVMNYRKDILALHEQRSTALEDAKNNAIKRDEQFNQQTAQAHGELAKKIKETWDTANTELLGDKMHGHLFSEVEGDQDGNQRLAKGFELVDRAFSENPNDPRLSVEDRASVVKRHAAVRMRAAAFGRLNSKYIKLQQEHDALKKELSGYRASVPSTGGTATSSNSNGHQSGMDRIRAELLKIAKPG
jgi:hypothetical protein